MQTDDDDDDDDDDNAEQLQPYLSIITGFWLRRMLLLQGLDIKDGGAIYTDLDAWSIRSQLGPLIISNLSTAESANSLS